MLARTTSSYVAQSKAKDDRGNSESDEAGLHPDDDEENEDGDDGGPASGSPSGAMSQVKLASKCGMYDEISSTRFCIDLFTEPRYPHNLYQLAEQIRQPQFPLALRCFLVMHNHPDQQTPAEIKDLPLFEGEIKVYHSAVAVYYVPSDLCGAGGLYRERIRSAPSL